MSGSLSNLWGLLGDQGQQQPAQMPGLLDPGEMRSAGMQEGLLRAAAAMAEASRPRMIMREGPGPGLMGGLVNAVGGFAQGRREGQRGYMQEQQMQGAMARESDMQAALSSEPDERLPPSARNTRSLLAGLPANVRAMLPTMDPQQRTALISQLATRESDPFRNVRFEGGYMHRPDGQGGFTSTALPRQAPELNPNQRFVNVPGQGLVDTWALQGRPGASPAPATGGADPQGGDPLAPYVEAVVGRESGGRADARNPLSTATGAGQFLDGTWLDMWGRHGARLAQGRADLASLDPNKPEDRQRILALRTDPQLSRSMVAAYAQENAPLLRQAVGGEPTPTDLYIGHFFGGQGGARFAGLARTAPDTPVDMALPRDVLQANRPVFFRPDNTVRTVGEVYNSIDQDMRGRITRAQVANIGQRPQAPGVVIPAQDNDRADYNVPGVGVQRLPVAAAQALGLTRATGQGVSVNTGPDGRTSVQIGGSAPPPGSAQPGQPIPTGMAPGTTANLEERIVQHTERAGRLDEIATRFRPEFLRVGPQVSNWTTAQMDRLGMRISPADRRALTEYTQFRQAAFTDMNDTLKAMSGAAVSDGEAQRQMRVLGNADSDSPTEFQAKLRQTQEFTQLATARLHWMRSRGLSPTTQNFEAHPLSEIRSTINSRGAELARGLAAQGVPEDQIGARVTAALTQEFGIRPGGR